MTITDTQQIRKQIYENVKCMVNYSFLEGGGEGGSSQLNMLNINQFG